MPLHIVKPRLLHARPFTSVADFDDCRTGGSMDTASLIGPGPVNCRCFGPEHHGIEFTFSREARAHLVLTAAHVPLEYSCLHLRRQQPYSHQRCNVWCLTAAVGRARRLWKRPHTPAIDLGLTLAIRSNLSDCPVYRGMRQHVLLVVKMKALRQSRMLRSHASRI